MNVSGFLGRAAAAILMAGLAAPGIAWSGEHDRDHERDKRREAREASQERREYEKQLRAARREFQAAARRLQELQEKRIQQRFRLSKRGRLGVVVDTAPGAPRDPAGAVVVAITPGTPAEEAGLRPGDVILKMNGDDLVVRRGGSRPVQVGPAVELIRRARSLQAGQQVTLEYRRGGTTGVVVMEASPAAGSSFSFTVSPQIEIPSFQFDYWPYALLEYKALDEETLRKWRELELVELTPALGKYFGSRQGVLVVRTPDEALLDVEIGDVIIRIGDIETVTPLDAVRTLRSIRPGEPIDIKVLRNRNVVTVRTEVPVIHRLAAPDDEDD